MRPTAYWGALLAVGPTTAGQVRAGSDERAEAGDRPADDQGIDLAGALVTRVVELLRAGAEGVGLLRVRGDRLEATSLRHAWAQIDDGSGPASAMPPGTSK
jgi:hypothetical protein